MKERINLNKVALIGRTFGEYYKIFRLNDFKSKNLKILDVGSGVSSFCAEAQDVEMNVMAMDPIYDHNAKKLAIKCEQDIEMIIKELDGAEHLYIWNIFKNKEHLKKQREEAYKKFINHYRNNRKNK